MAFRVGPAGGPSRPSRPTTKERSGIRTPSRVRNPAWLTTYTSEALPVRNRVAQYMGCVESTMPTLGKCCLCQVVAHVSTGQAQL